MPRKREAITPIRFAGRTEPCGGTMAGTKENAAKYGFPQPRGVTGEYNSFWPPKCGGLSESLNIRKGFRHNVEAHESTCDTRSAG